MEGPIFGYHFRWQPVQDFLGILYFRLIRYIAKTVMNTLLSSFYVLITDEAIAKLHLKASEQGFQAAPQDPKISGIRSRLLSSVIPPGETSKSREGKT